MVRRILLGRVRALRRYIHAAAGAFATPRKSRLESAAPGFAPRSVVRSREGPATLQPGVWAAGCGAFFFGLHFRRGKALCFRYGVL